jgi:hypothetical protein
MCIKINKIGKQEVGIWWVQTRFPRYGVPIWSLWPNIRFLPSIIWTYMHIFCHIFLSNYWWQRSDIWSQASYRYPISLEAFFDPSTIWGTYMKLVTKYQISAINSCWEKCDEKWAYSAPSVYRPPFYRQPRISPKFSSVPISPIKNTLLYCQTTRHFYDN